jgi:hypothetical protein
MIGLHECQCFAKAGDAAKTWEEVSVGSGDTHS